MDDETPRDPVPSGEPLKQNSSLDTLVRAGVQMNDDGSANIPAAVMQKLRADAARKMAVTHVPSTPRHLQRDGGGIGVQKGGGQFANISLELLRTIRERAPIIQTIHAARAHQVRRMSRKWPGQRGEVGWRIVHRDTFEAKKDPPDWIKPYVKRAEDLFRCPSAVHCKTLSTFMQQVEEDLLTINRPSVEVLFSLFRPGRIVGARPVDGTLVWPTLVWVEKWMRDTPEWWGQHDRSALTDIDIMDLASASIDHDLHGAEYCLVRDGVLENVFAPGRLIVAPVVNRTNIELVGYPPSNVEQSLGMILSFINAWDMTDNYFTKGMLSEFILGLSGDIHDDDVDAFVDMFREGSQGVRRAHQPLIMPLPVDGTITKIDLKPLASEMYFEGWMSLQTALVTGIYRMDPSTINAKPWAAGGGSSLGEANRTQEIQLAKEEGLQGDLQHIADNILTPLLQRIHPDLVWHWEYGDFDPKVEAEVHGMTSKVDMSRNDVRLEKGNTPRGFWLDDDELKTASDEDKEKYEQNPWNMPADPGFSGTLQQQAQQKMMEEQGGDPGMMGPDGQPMPPGAEGEPGGEDDGFGMPPGSEQDDGFGGAADQFPFGQSPNDQKNMQKGRRQSPIVTRVTVYEERTDG